MGGLAPFGLVKLGPDGTAVPAPPAAAGWQPRK